MAVKPILNKQIISRPNNNRGTQRSTKNMKWNSDARNYNSKKSVLPGKDFTKNFAVTLKDIDLCMLNHVRDVMQITIRESGENVRVPVMYGNQERWKNVRKNGAVRDRNGSLIMPLIMIRRTDVNFNPSMPFSYDQDLKGIVSNPVRVSKWSKDNRYSRFGVQHGQQPIREMITTGVPDWVDCTYSIVALTNDIEQMNLITETFVFHENTYWGEALDFRFLSQLGGSFADATEMDVDGERLVKLEFEIILKGYLLPEAYNTTPTGKVFDVGRGYTVGKVVFVTESDATTEPVSKK